MQEWLPLITKRIRARATTVGLLLVLAQLTSGCGGEGASCEVGEPVELSLAAWSGELRSADPAGGGYDSLLVRLGVAPLPETVGNGPMELVSVDSMEVRRGGNAAADVLLTARFRDPNGAESLRARLLRPVAGRQDAWCALTGDLSRDKEAHEEPCLEPYDGPPRELGTEALLAPDRDAIVVRDAGGWCGMGTARGDRFATSYWGVEAGRLTRYLEVVTFEARYESPLPPIETRRGELELSGDWPRAITVRETVECLELDEPSSAETGCEPLAVTREYRYANGRYRAVGAAPPATAEPAGRQVEETTP